MQPRLLSGSMALAWIFWGLISPASAANCKSGRSPCRVLYFTYTAGYRHDSIPASKEVLQAVASHSGLLEVVPSEDLSLINADALSGFDALFFFTSGELPLTDRQKSDLLSFVRSGGGFGGVHSATDTFYTWPEYGDLIGAYFDGHPWVQPVRIDVEDPDHPAMRDLAPSFQIFDEIYQLRNLSRDRTRVLMTLDTSSVDLGADGVHRTDGDFALAWSHLYGQGRVFYTALGHFESTWRDDRFQRMLLNALLWMTGQVDGDASPRGATPVIGEGGVGDAIVPGRALAACSYIAIYGQNLTAGSTFSAPGPALPLKLVGTVVLVNGAPIPLLYASPRQVNAQLPVTLTPGQAATLQVWSGGQVSNAIEVRP
jgi:type 1 glutamine amidotransferase